MNGDERRKELLNIIRNNPISLSGTELARKLDVSRQVIVQDIALLRATDYDIISTNKGYILNVPNNSQCSRIFKVHHNHENTEDELNTIIDAGGKVIDVFVAHTVYGQLRASLEIYSRRDIKKFIERMNSGESVPLMNITAGEHFHTVQAYSEEILDDVAQALKDKGYIVSDLQIL